MLNIGVNTGYLRSNHSEFDWSIGKSASGSGLVATLGEETTDQLEMAPRYLCLRRLIPPEFVKIDTPHQLPLFA
jgi:hypothetical protein